MNDLADRYAELLVHAHEEIFKDNPRHYFVEQLELIRQAKESVWSALSAGRAREETGRIAAEAADRRENSLRQETYRNREEIRDLKRKIWKLENPDKKYPFELA